MNTILENLRQALAAWQELVATDPTNTEAILQAGNRLADATQSQIDKETFPVEIPDFVRTTGVFINGAIAGGHTEPPFDDFTAHLLPAGYRRRLLSQ